MFKIQKNRRRRGILNGKRISQMAHARKRFKERLDIDFTRAMHYELVKKITRNELEFIKKQSNRISIFKAIINDKTVQLVYDRKRGNIVTVLVKDKDQRLRENKDHGNTN